MSEFRIHVQAGGMHNQTIILKEAFKRTTEMVWKPTSAQRQAVYRLVAAEIPTSAPRRPQLVEDLLTLAKSEKNNVTKLELLGLLDKALNIRPESARTPALFPTYNEWTHLCLFGAIQEQKSVLKEIFVATTRHPWKALYNGRQIIYHNIANDWSEAPHKQPNFVTNMLTLAREESSISNKLKILHILAEKLMIAHEDNRFTREPQFFENLESLCIFGRFREHTYAVIDFGLDIAALKFDPGSKRFFEISVNYVQEHIANLTVEGPPQELVRIFKKMGLLIKNHPEIATADYVGACLEAMRITKSTRPSSRAERTPMFLGAIAGDNLKTLIRLASLPDDSIPSLDELFPTAHLDRLTKLQQLSSSRSIRKKARETVILIIRNKPTRPKSANLPDITNIISRFCRNNIPSPRY